MLLPYILGAVLLTQSNIAALQSAKQSPNTTNALKAIIDDRPVILWRATFAIYPGPVSGGIQSIATLTLPTLTPGDQFRLTVAGIAFNNAALTEQIGVVIRLTQGATVQNIGIPASLPNTGGLTPVAWRSDIVLGVNVPGADGQYLSPISNAAVKPSTSPRQTLPQASIGFTGAGSTLITDTNSTGGIFAGGRIVAGTSSSTMLATRTQLSYSNAQPILVDIMLDGANQTACTVTVETGYLEGL